MLCPTATLCWTWSAQQLSRVGNLTLREGGAGLWLAPAMVAAPFSPSRITSLRTSETGPSQTQLLLLSSCELTKPVSGLWELKWSYQCGFLLGNVDPFWSERRR